jgi:hypothetical protein
LTPEMRTVLYDLTQGVTDFLIKLLVLAQRHAIHTGEERLTVRLLRTIADTRMQLLKPALGALRSGDAQRMAQFEDLLPADSQIAAMMGTQDRDERVSTRLSLLHALRRPKASHVTALVEDVESEPSAVTGAGEPEPVATSEASRLAACEDPLAALGEAGWVSSDALEFSAVYAAT